MTRLTAAQLRCLRYLATVSRSISSRRHSVTFPTVMVLRDLGLVTTRSSMDSHRKMMNFGRDFAGNVEHFCWYTEITDVGRAVAAQPGDGPRSIPVCPDLWPLAQNSDQSADILSRCVPLYFAAYRGI